MLQAFLTFINQNQLFQPNDRLLLTVSGGRDSVVLVYLCQQADFDFGMAHCNFQLRGQESEGDADFVRQLATRCGVPFYEERFDTAHFATQNGLSTQMAARDLRYAWFEKIRATHQYDWILTAHHQNDVLETILLNLTRGSNWAGLQGILPKNGRVLRPLLFATQDDIASFATQAQLTWREDSSNQTDYYHRNLLRHQVVPVLQQINPKVVGAVAETAARMAAVVRIWQENLAQTTQQITTQEGNKLHISYELLGNFSEPVERLAGLLRPFGFTFGQVQQIWAARHGQAGKVFLSASHVLLKDRSVFVLTEKSTPPATEEMLLQSHEQSWTLPHCTIIRTDLPPNISVVFEKNSDFLYVDAALLRFPLVLCRWQMGDWFCPLGMGGKHKKVSDFLIDQKMPLTAKNEVWVLKSDGQVVWVVGFRADERFKINDSTKNSVKFIKT
ncbi:MAG: tRNA lysidine(34) synthetase TilS [Cytophagia bacterium]|nr:MAG: tRNA lysidine(34) synthetase TilS [Runella sp.]TAG16308.1 MAG: tRNA lysidine(34) synthetase TilS [Cytophagales bacterium]TAG35669.1 MAG: tRNA lysidine(34) synthetase TilS [Cytophagia bacterium]TAG77402.1 MAG: tRNA lysidine(34) synthetase TilS [Cytophagales bacterium]